MVATHLVTLIQILGKTVFGVPDLPIQIMFENTFNLYFIIKFKTTSTLGKIDFATDLKVNIDTR